MKHEQRGTFGIPENVPQRTINKDAFMTVGSLTELWSEYVGEVVRTGNHADNDFTFDNFMDWLNSEIGRAELSDEGKKR